MEDGSSKNMLHQYRKNPKGFRFYRIENLKNPKGSIIYKYKECIHYVSSCLLDKEYNFFKNNPQKLLTFFSIPLGCLLYSYIVKNTQQ